MGQHEAIVVALLLAPVIVLMVLRINAAMVFLSLCLGYVVMQFLSSDVQAFATLFMAHASVSISVMKLGLLMLPAALTALFMIGTARGVRLILNVLPALGVGYLMVLFAVPALSSGLAHAIMALSLWHQAVRLQAALVGGGALISLFFLWSSRFRHHHESSSHEKRRKSVH